MPSNITARIQTVIEKGNKTPNDYSYVGGWGGRPAPVLGQQYRFDEKETEALIAGLSAEFKTQKTLQAAIKKLFQLASVDQAVGGIAFADQAAAAAMTQFARQNFVPLNFGANDMPPTHPAG